MAQARYEYRLWQDRPGFLGKVRGDRPVAGPVTSWFDLDDKAGTVAQMARLIEQHHGGRAGSIEQYWLEILDPVTGQLLTKITPSEYDLAVILDGTRDANGTQVRSRPVTDDISDEALLSALAKRLAERRALRQTLGG